MDLRIGHLNLGPPPTRPRRTAAQFAPAAGKSDAAAVPASPPPDVLREVDAAGRRAEELWNARRGLHFEVDDDSGRVSIHVGDGEGNVLRTISPSEALDIISGSSV
jgi:hypothetical protein